MLITSENLTNHDYKCLFSHLCLNQTHMHVSAVLITIMENKAALALIQSFKK